MTSDYHRLRGCSGKRKYVSREQAEAALCRMRMDRRIKKLPGLKLTVYRCDTCYWFHIGNSEE